MNIRPFDHSDADYEAMVDINNVTFPNNLNTVDARKSWDAIRDKQYFFERLIAEDNEGKILGLIVVLEPFWSHRPGKYFIFANVYPDYWGRGIGSALYEAAIDIIRPKHPTMLTSETREHLPQAMKFLEKRGYQLVQRQPISRLDVTAFDPTPFRDAVARFETSGLCIYTTTELEKSDPDYWRKVHKLDGLIWQDVPMPEPYTQPNLEQFIKTVKDPKRGYNPDAWFIAVVPTADGLGEYVGMSCLWNDVPGSTKMYTGLTGVLREYRRKGVATTLKVRAIEYAKRRRSTLIETDNEDNNPMFQLNVALGFREVTASLEYQKRLSES